MSVLSSTGTGFYGMPVTLKFLENSALFKPNSLRTSDGITHNGWKQTAFSISRISNGFVVVREFSTPENYQVLIEIKNTLRQQISTVKELLDIVKAHQKPLNQKYIP